jgi:hypothetical protein
MNTILDTHVAYALTTVGWGHTLRQQCILGGIRPQGQLIGIQDVPLIHVDTMVSLRRGHAQLLELTLIVIQ